MFASLSAESRAPQLMRELGISNAFVSALCNIEQTKLSFAFRQMKALPTEDAVKLMLILPRLLELRDALHPLQIDLKNPSNARSILEAFEGMDVETIREKVVTVLKK
jgi:predicted component of type VI protein secretion system